MRIGISADAEIVVLFGSHARGEARENSDVDLLLVKDVEDKISRQLKLEARKRVRELISSYISLN